MSPESREQLIQIEGVKKSFKSHEVLHDVSLTVAEGEVLVLIGRSGSGKSTLLHCLAGLTKIDTGRILFRGVPLQQVPRPRDVNRKQVRLAQRDIGMVFQQYNLFPHLTVLDNVTLALRVAHHMRREEAVEIGERQLELVGLSTHKAHYPGELSGGQQQRVAIARALAANASAILFDEVTAALDPELVGEVLRVMRQLASSGMTMIVVTHEMQFAREVADRVVFMEGGVIVEEGTADQVLRDPQHPQTRQFLSRLLDRTGAEPEMA